MSLEQFTLKDKVILISGASGGIGRQTAIAISQAGAKVIITGRDEVRLNETFRQLEGSGHQMIITDLCNEDEISQLAQQTDAVDGIVHGAGIVEHFPTKFINRKKINATFEVNFIAPVLLMTALFRHKKINKNCSVVFISSRAGEYPYQSGALYSASKIALESYSKVLAVEHADIKLRSNAIAPAIVKTNMFDQTVKLLSQLNSSAEIDRKSYLLGYGEPQDVANIILFLLSDASKWITGQTIPMDGGYLRGLTSNL